MSTVILFITYILVSTIFTWKYVDFIKQKQWDIKSARLLLGIFIGIIGLLLLSIRVAFLGGIEEGNRNEINLTLILGSVIMIVIILLSLWVMSLVRKMKYMEVTFKIPINDATQGSLSEKNMTCLVDRDQVLNLQKIMVKKEKDIEAEIEFIEKS
jgi:amino acid transporter